MCHVPGHPGFPKTKIGNETAYIWNEEFKVSLQEDGRIIGSSLRFIDELLSSMLDIYRTNCCQQARSQVGSY
jgi:hypothetical protein